MPSPKRLVRFSHANRAQRSFRSLQWIQPKRQFSRSVPVGAGAGAVTGAAEEEVQSARRYCIELLGKYDRPSYTLNTFVPHPARTFYIALRALNVSLSMVPESTSSTTAGLMRLQYWRDAITKTLSGAPPREPVAILLASAVEDVRRRTRGKMHVSKGWFMRMINARERTLTNDPFPDLAAMESYAENTYSTLLYLTNAALPMSSMTADHVASHIGKAAGITAILRGLPLVAFPHRRTQGSNNPAINNGAAPQGAVMLPLDIMAEAGVREEEVFRKGAEATGLRDAVFAVATRANDHLITVQQMLDNIRSGEDVGHEYEHQGEEGHEYEYDDLAIETPLDEVNRAFGVFMPAVATRLWLERLQSVDFDIFQPELLRSDWKLPWRAYWAYKRRVL